MQSDVNKTQVGGSHYKTQKAMQHWDLCCLFRWPYLRSCALKYMWRWRLKNGIQDLEKAAHYVEKNIASFPQVVDDSIWPEGGIQIIIDAKDEMKWDKDTWDIISVLIDKEIRISSLRQALVRITKLIEEETCRKALLGEGPQPTAAQLHPS